MAKKFFENEDAKYRVEFELWQEKINHVDIKFNNMTWVELSNATQTTATLIFTHTLKTLIESVPDDEKAFYADKITQELHAMLWDRYQAAKLTVLEDLWVEPLWAKKSSWLIS